MTQKEQDKQEMADIREIIKKYGWFVGFFDADTATPSFGYTIGLWEKFKHPEIITFGLPVEVIQDILNTAAAKVKDGKPLLLNLDDKDILEDLPVRFRTVHEENVNDYMGYAQRYYNGKTFPVIQLYWTDGDKHYPWDKACEEAIAFSQPLLDKKLDFKFFEQRNTSVFTTRHIMKDKQPVLYVCHEEEDGAWQFLPGIALTDEDMMVVSMEEMVKLDPTLNELFNLPIGEIAIREFVGDKWERMLASEEE
jgi:hypothetical protein